MAIPVIRVPPEFRRAILSNREIAPSQADSRHSNVLCIFSWHSMLGNRLQFGYAWIQERKPTHQHNLSAGQGCQIRNSSS